ncbi:MAG: transketolase [Nanoarchaeota archaeon]|nr:transketolase [Nanoarchaeota archaeon]
MSNNLIELAKLVRYYILLGTKEAGSGHPTSSASAVELMACLCFGGYFRADLEDPENPNNDRLIFSKGHAAPLLYALYAAAGKVSEEEIKTLRKFGSRLEGHPTLEFPYTEAPTGSLGQGLSIGVGMAINGKHLDNLPYKTYVLLGDSEMAEGSVWEAMEVAAHYKLDNLVAILDVNRLGQRGETMHGHDVRAYGKKAEAFGWHAVTLPDGHNIGEIQKAYNEAGNIKEKPVIIIAKTQKGKGFPGIENADGWHGRALKGEDYEKAIAALGEVRKDIRGEILAPEKRVPAPYAPEGGERAVYKEPAATRKAYGNALVRIHKKHPEIVVLDAETSNSTFAEMFKKKYPDRFFEMYIAEQNMVGAALGLARRGKLPCVSTFAAFFTRAFDQIRMCGYSDAHIIFAGSHAGVSIGEDGASQMGLEDIAMFRAVEGSVVLYPSDAVATEALVGEAARHKGIVYIRTTRKDTPILYNESDEFHIGGSKVIRETKNDVATIIGAGITLYEALDAEEELKKQGIAVRVIDLYSVKPIDTETLQKAARETKRFVIVEDHVPEGGMGEAVRSALEGEDVRICSLAIRKRPKSGTPEELLRYEEISKEAIIKKIKEII